MQKNKEGVIKRWVKVAKKKVKIETNLDKTPVIRDRCRKEDVIHCHNKLEYRQEKIMINRKSKQTC